MPQSLPQIRRRNLLFQLQLYAHRQLDAGQETGSSTSFAQLIGVHKSLLSKLKGEGKSSRDISDPLARQIEAALGLAPMWMDQEHEDAPMTTAERSYLELCLRTYRATNAAGRSFLRKRATQEASEGYAPR